MMLAIWWLRKSWSGLLRRSTGSKAQKIRAQLREAQDPIVELCEADKYGHAVLFDWSDIAESVVAELRSIGFQRTYRDGAELLEWYRDLLREKFHDLLGRAVPTPDIDEQIANDWAVKAAKQAYDEAYAKAKARKRL